MKSIKIYKKNWCIKLTVENIDKVKQYLLGYSITKNEWMSWTIGAYYGINDIGLLHGSVNRFSLNLLTDAEFDKMFYNKSLKDEYEIF